VEEQLIKKKKSPLVISKSITPKTQMKKEKEKENTTRL
jgi:hypothetical protein